MLIVAVLLVAAYANGQTTPVPILKQINRVNDDGSYTYGFEAADGTFKGTYIYYFYYYDELCIDGTFKVETRDNLGNVRGKYGYVDETGVLKTIEYAAGQGFEAQGSHIPVADVPSAVPLPAAQPIAAAHPRRPVPRPVAAPTTFRPRPAVVEQPAPAPVPVVPARNLPTPSLSVPSFSNVRQQQPVAQQFNNDIAVNTGNAGRGFSFSFEAPVFHPTTTTPNPFFNQGF